MKQAMKKLEVGDIIYRKHRIYGVREMLTIERVTPTQAVCKDKRFKREVNGGEVIMIGQSRSRDRERYFLETEELKEEYLREKLIEKMQGIDYSKLTTETLQQMDSLEKYYQ